MTRGTGRPPRYAALAAHLAALPADVAHLELTFAELEAILGAPLPATAAYRSGWWVNTMITPQSRAWLGAGWRASRPRRFDQRVVFTRAEVDER